jgi:tetratricopeptide (TPR) repeat protein
MRRAAGLILVVAVVSAAGAPAVVAAPTEAEAVEARRHYAQGSRAYDLAEYEEALREFKEAYRIVDDPAFLFNIAQCHRKLGRLPDAITFYRSYLRRAPHTPNRAEVERIIAEAERAEVSRPAAPAPSEPSHVPPPAAVSPPLLAAPNAPSPPPPVPTVAATSDRPFYRSTWFWVAAGVVLVGAGAATFFALRPDAGAGPFCLDCATVPAIDPR